MRTPLSPITLSIIPNQDELLADCSKEESSNTSEEEADIDALNAINFRV